MTPIAAYLWRIICGCVICAIIEVMTHDKKGIRHISRILSGIYLAVIVLSPITGISFSGIWDRWDAIQYDASHTIADGQAQAYSAKEEIITEAIEAYILKKAADSDLKLQVEVSISADMIPNGVRITGKAAPAEKRRLQQIIESELAIPKEQQIWNS